MVDTYSSGKLGLVEPSRGSYVDTWDEPLYANWQTIEAAISGTTPLVLTSSNIVLTVPTFPTYPNPPTTANSAQNLRLLLQGAPSVNLVVYIPATIAGFWIVDDHTGGTSTVTIKTTAVGSVGVESSRGNTLIVYSDGTDVKLADSGNIPAIATNTVAGLVTQGLLAGNCVNLDSSAKIPYQTDKYIISSNNPDAAQGSQDWLWMKVQ